MADNGDSTYCTNCKRDIASANFVMHEIHCRRHIILCEHCHEPVPRSELEQHFNDLHAKVLCEQCQMSVAKDGLEMHMDTDCPKKPVRCEFCELTVPQSEHRTHIGYCGSRTEQCHMCHQYIMLKDMVKHEESMCTFPEPKPLPVSTNHSDPFRMDDFQFLLDQQFSTRDNFPDFASNLRQELARARKPPANRSQKPSNDDNRRAGNTVKKKSDVNVQKARNLVSTSSGEDNLTTSSLPSSIPPDMDYDTMLALQMAHEDWQWQQEPSPPSTEVSEVDETWDNRDNTFNIEELMDHVRRTNNSNIAPISESRNINKQTTTQAANEYSDEDMCIPCEFCDVDIPLNSYLSHVESCPQGEGSQDNRHNIPTVTETHTRAAIPVINNLHTNDPLVSSVNDAPLRRDTFDEQFVLPCEFCEEVFPADIIFQHQNVCQANGMTTPRVTTPIVNTRASPLTSTKVSVQRQHSNPSLIDFVDDNFDDGAEGSSNDNFFRVHKQSSDSPSEKYHPGLNRFDNAVARPPRRTSRQNDFTPETQIPNNEVPAPRQSKSALRARARLNQLLQEDSAIGATAAAVGDRRKTSKTEHLVKKSGSRREQRTQVSSRTVMGQLDRPGQRKETNKSETSGAPVARSRQRADHVFSPDLRLKPPPNSKK